MASKRIALSLEENIKVTDFHKKGKPEQKLADIFHCGKTQTQF